MAGGDFWLTQGQRGCSQSLTLQILAHSQAGGQGTTCPSTSEQLACSVASREPGALRSTVFTLFHQVLATSDGTVITPLLQTRKRKLPGKSNPSQFGPKAPAPDR